MEQFKKPPEIPAKVFDWLERLKKHQQSLTGADPRLLARHAGRAQRMNEHCYIERGTLGRWIISKVNGTAWSGSRWMAHAHGAPAAGVQISNFDTRTEALNVAHGLGFTVLEDGYLVEDDESITCFMCGWTSYSEADIRERYCGNCHQFHERK